MLGSVLIPNSILMLLQGIQDVVRTKSQYLLKKDMTKDDVLAFVYTHVSQAHKYIKYGVCQVFMLIQLYLPRFYSLFDLLLLFIVDICRLFSGLFAAYNVDASKKPKSPLILYEFEACPFCRKVREVMNMLELEYLAQPCPRETLTQAGYCKSSRFRKILRFKGRPLQFPYLEDANTGTQIQNSTEICNYLWKEYGNNSSPPMNYRLVHWGILETITLAISTFWRPCTQHGLLRAPSKTPTQPLHLYGCEASGFCRLIRETLCTLEIPYTMHPMPMKFPKISIFSPIQSIKEIFQMIIRPFRTKLIDPNTATELYNFKSIVAYIKETYQLENAPEESWLDYGLNDKKAP